MIFSDLKCNSSDSSYVNKYILKLILFQLYVWWYVYKIIKYILYDV